MRACCSTHWGNHALTTGDQTTIGLELHGGHSTAPVGSCTAVGPCTSPGHSSTCSGGGGHDDGISGVSGCRLQSMQICLYRSTRSDTIA